jgi:Flp pilus assembly protein TadG
MKNKILLGALLLGTATIMSSCSDDNDCNPTILQPTEFHLNTPGYANEDVNMKLTDALTLTWSQPQYTAENAPVNATYEIQLSKNGNYTTAYDDNADDNSNADYIVMDEKFTTCASAVPAESIDKCLVKLLQWTDETMVPDLQTVFVRVNSYIADGTLKRYAIASNAIQLSVVPYYIELSDAAPIMWYLVGNNIMDGSWSNLFENLGIGSGPMFIIPGNTYDKTTGAGEIQYLNYFTTDGWKLLSTHYPTDASNTQMSWDYGFMGGGSANTAVFRNGDNDAGNIWCEPEGIYLVTVNTASNECKISKYENQSPTVYDKICITGSFNDWSDTEMIPANKEGQNHVWYYIADFSSDVTSIKFKIAGSWDTNWGYGSYDGEINTVGTGTGGGCNIGVAPGTWIIAFNDITGDFSIIKK